MESFPSTVQFQGRWDLEDDNRCATWCGSSIHFRTSSQFICLELGKLTTPRPRQRHPNILWNFGSHSETRKVRAKGPGTLFLKPETGDEVEEVFRDVTVMLCDWGASLHILNIRTTDNKPILTPATGLPIRPLLFIGASLVSGFTPPFRGDVLPQGSFQAFGSVAARIMRARGLDVRLEMVAYPGLKLMTTEHEKGMEDIFWDGREGFGGWNTRSNDSPHDIFICIGSNDRAWGGDQDEFLEHYNASLSLSHSSFNRLPWSPFGNFHDVIPTVRRTVYEPDVQHMVEALAQSWAIPELDSTKLYHISTEGWIAKSHTCDGLHPTIGGHERIGAKLVEFIEAQNVL